MEYTEDNDNKKFWHRKQCSSRVFIGPWDINMPPPPEQFLPHLVESIPSIDSDSSLKLLNYNTFSSETSPPTKDESHNIGTPLSDGTSFITARSSNTNSTGFKSADTTPHFLEQIVNNDDEDDEIDYQFLADAPVQPLISTDTDAESIKTVRPSKGKLPIRPSTTTTALSTPIVNTFTKKKKRKVRRPGKKPLLWKKSGSVFISTDVTREPASVPTDKPLKHEPILCMRSVTEYTGTEPSTYRAEKDARFDLLNEEWKQMELVLTNKCLSTYCSSTLFWPLQKLEHRVYLQGSKKQNRLELFLFSPLDYTFCLRYVYTPARTPMIVTMTFKARSFLKCQEWYMKIYDLLPDECKRPCPNWCEVYIPLLDLSVNLPLTNVKHYNEITLEDVKDAVVTVLEEDDGDMESLKKMEKWTSTDELGLCWATEDRAEWVYWTTCSSDEHERIDWVICPQSIEQTHRLELRPIQHTPHDIILQENFTLKEPPPVEGFLTSVTDFHGRMAAIYTGKTNYYATFDQFLFYTPTLKVSPPDSASFIDENLLPRNIRIMPYISGISPYTQSSTKKTETQEIKRRMDLMIEAKGVIDLTEVSYVRRSFSNDLGEEREQSHSHISLGKRSSRSPMIQPEEQQTLFHPKSHHNQACLELIMENGLQIKFEAYTSDTCDSWVKYLAQIIVYWKARKEAEKDAHTHDRFSNNNISSTDTEDTLIKDNGQIDTKKGCVHRHQEMIADTRIWSYCLYEQCRDVVVY
ncbi:uncharacterized protein EV154DRAFT_24887 [Mucor mucedo]|uniref:uncharacterized protein n=1 Tax=Mucor mucedo TaxID=29922 RepID=UPI002220412C|nr:uncharacterized protein EV154DRAFT_24887 [Mucor mucedo]KAI7885476.1 hypothetical protein EV154DRAFT_24887 [Mucor mucedo]